MHYIKQDYTLKKCISKKTLILPPQKNILILPHKKMYFKIAPSKNVFLNCYKLSIENKSTRYVNYSIFKK